MSHAHIGFVNGALVIGDHVLSENIEAGDEGFNMQGVLHIDAFENGVAGSIEFHGGTEPPAPMDTAHRFWPDLDGNIFWQDNAGVSRMLHAAGGDAPGQWLLNGSDIYYSAGKVGIGTSAIPHGGVGRAMFAIDGPNAHNNGPHIQYTTDADNFPLFQQLNWRHGDIYQLFDSYYDSDGLIKSSDAGSNLIIQKGQGNRLRFRYDSGVTPGDPITWNEGFSLSLTDGKVNLYGELDIGSNPFTINSLEIVGADGEVNKAVVEDSSNWDTGYLLAQNVQTTGLTSGAVITKASDTTLDISPGTGYISDYSDPANPTVIPVTFGGVTGYTPANLGADGTFIVGIDSSGSLIELSSGFSNQDKQDNILIGIYIANSGSILTTVDAPFNLGYDGTVTARDFIRDVIGPANIVGNIISPNGANLNLDTNAGTIFIVAGNFRNNPEVPDEISISSQAAFPFVRVYRQASPSNQLANTGPPGTSVDPDQWDDGSGTLVSVPVNDFTIPVVYVAPNGSYWVAFGQEVFNTMANAEAALLNGTLSFEEYPFQQGIVRRCFFIVRQGATDLSNTSDAKFFADGKFRVGGISTSSGVTPPGGSDGYVQFNDNGAFGGDSDFSWSSVNSRLSVKNLSVNGVVITGHMADIQGTAVSRIPYGDSFGGFSDSDNLKFANGALSVIGNVGIGKTSPNEKLHIHSDSAINTSIQMTNSVSGSTSNDGLIIGIDADGSGRIEMKDDETLSIYSPSSGERMRFGRGSTNGQVFIGTIGSEAASVGDLYAGGYAGIKHENSTSIAIVQNGNGRTIISYDSSQYLDIQTDNSNSVVRFAGDGSVDFTGNVTVGGNKLVTVIGTPLSDQIPKFYDGNTISGNSNFLFDGITLSTPRINTTGDVEIGGNLTVDSNFVIEGSSSKNILRKIQLQVRDGAIPGTNIDITKFTSQGREYNAPAITDADDLAKSGTSGSYGLSTNGENLTLTLTETVTTVLSAGVISDDLNNGGGGGYYVHTLVIDGNIQLMVEKSGNTTNLDWTDVTNTGSDFIIFDIALLTSD